MAGVKWLGVCALLVGCSADPPRGSATPIARDAQGHVRMIAAHDLVAPAATATESARVHVQQLASLWGVRHVPVLAGLGEVPVRGGTIARLAQIIDGLPVWHGELRVLVKPGGVLHVASGTLVGTETPREPAHFIDDRAHAIARAAGIDVRQAIAKQVWYPLGARLVAAWVVDAYTGNGDASRTILAGDGHVLARTSLTADAFTYGVFAEQTGELHPFDGPIVDATPHPTGVPDKSFPAYVSGPSLVTVQGLDQFSDPWLPDGATETVGNNVDAYADLNAPTGLTAGDFRATVSSPGTFDYVYDTSAGPLVSQQQGMASITSLFYVLNWLHDFWYDAGFTEAAGNAQLDNYGRGGVDGDPILGEAQDNALGGSRNNANMATPMDGMQPRMQVYLWTGRNDRTFTMSPSGRSPIVGYAYFGPTDFNFTAELVLAADSGGASVTDGCDPLVGVAGKVVVVDRGNCKYKAKALNIQNAGGVGMIVIDNQSNTNPPLLGDEPTITATITIGMFSVTGAEGAQIKADLAAGSVTGTMFRHVHQELDGSLDSTLIAHEFGHYIHHRLSECENTMCRAMSEGWGDFDALLVEARPGDNLDGAFPFSIYATQGFSLDPGYYGIRREPYCVNFAIDGLSFRHMADGEPLPTDIPMLSINNNAEVHNAGEVWATALWEGYVALQKAGTSFEAVRRNMQQYVVAGLLLAPPEASPMETRDALLEAAAAASETDRDLLLAAFARRGFGSCAIAPPPESDNFVGLVESTVVAGNPKVTNVVLDDDCDHDGILDAGETATLTIRVANQGHAPLTDVKLAVTSGVPGVTIMTPPIEMAELAPAAATEIEVQAKLDAGPGAIAGDLTLAITAAGGCTATTEVPVAFRLNVDDVPESSATDTCDAIDTTWRPWTAAWSHMRATALDGYWHGDDLDVVSDTRLDSIPLTASDTEPLVITFRHRYSFESGSYDGGVVEYSLDGLGYDDVSTIGTIEYSGTLALSDDPLTGKPAFVGQNAAYPDFETVRVDLGTALAGQQFYLRFRIGTDGGTGAPGWDIDDIAFSGIVGTPFTSVLPDDGVCGNVTPPDDTIGSGGGGCCDAGSPGSASLLAFGVLVIVSRRRARPRPRA